MTTLEIRALEELDALTARFSSLSEDDFEALNDAEFAYDAGEITRRQFASICRSYGFTIADVTVYMASLLW